LTHKTLSKTYLCAEPELAPIHYKAGSEPPAPECTCTCSHGCPACGWL